MKSKKIMLIVFGLILLNHPQTVNAENIVEEFPQGGLSLFMNDDNYANYIIETCTPTNIYTDIIDSLTEEEKELICRITYREAGNQNEEGQRAVIEVILNRTLHEDFPDDVYSVLSQKGQFTTWKRRNKVTSEQVEKMKDVLDTVYNSSDTILSDSYLYFGRKRHSYACNYIKIQDHWFGEQK